MKRLSPLLNTTKRGKYLKDWQQNVDLIYSEKNLNKLLCTTQSLNMTNDDNETWISELNLKKSDLKEIKS